MIHLLLLTVMLCLGACEYHPSQSDERTPSPAAQEPSAGDVARELREALDATSRFLQKKQAELLDRARRELAAVEEEIERFRKRAEDASRDTREELRKRLEELEEERGQLQEEIEKLRDTAAREWERAQSELRRWLDALEDRLGPERSPTPALEAT